MEVFVRKTSSDQQDLPTVIAQRVTMDPNVKIVCLDTGFGENYRMVSFLVGYFTCPGVGKYPDLFLYDQGKYFECTNVGGSKSTTAVCFSHH